MQECVLPVQCTQCGALFDLWYDLLEHEDKKEITREIAQERLRGEEHFCWGCRKQMFELRKEEGEAVIGAEEELELAWE
tara:strand:+ start:1057 stop:1293 length:237 start_codon:yes stop_codon:yes gene_type:complete